MKNNNQIHNVITLCDSESGTTIHKASLQSGAFFFSGYGRFLVVATGYLFAGFLAIFADVRYF